MSTATSTAPSLFSLSPAETSVAHEYLVATRDRLLETVTGLSDSQWNFKPSPERWSIAETLEHVVIVEGRVHGIIERMEQAPLDDPPRANVEVEQKILTEVPIRMKKYQAPPLIAPSNQWTPSETVARFLDGRSRTLELLASAPYLRERVIPHPVAGLWDGYQWILAAAAHSARHMYQILEVKTCVGYPQA